MATEPAPDTGTPTPASPPPPPPPIVIDGTTVPATAPAPTFGSTVDGKLMESQELFRLGDVVISREQVPSGDQFADTLVIKTGAGDDRVKVDQRADGVLDVQINGQAYEITLGSKQQLGVRTGDGNDIIETADKVKVNMDVRSGDGNDTVTTGAGMDRIDGGAGNDTIRSGAGRDDVFGNTGNDTIDAGKGNDVVYGGDGNDQIKGGAGRDYLEGGKGNDTLEGGNGKDILSGGLGDDTLRGDKGKDRIYGGSGADTVDNQSGKDVVYGRSGEDTITAAKGAGNKIVDPGAYDPNLGSSIVIVGSDEFRQRAEADIEMLRNSPQGRQMLAALDQAADPVTGKGHNVTLSELQSERNGTTNPVTPDGFLRKDASGNVIAGPGDNARVAYNPSFHSDSFPVPAVTLYHELSHAYNVVNGTLQSDVYKGSGPDKNKVLNAERQAVGLGTEGLTFDFDNDPNTKATKANPKALTENGMREEMGLDKRRKYGVDESDMVSPGTANLMPASKSAPQDGIVRDEAMERLLKASESSDRQGLQAGVREIGSSEFGQQFRKEGAEAADREAAQARAVLPDAAPVEEARQAGGMRR